VLSVIDRRWRDHLYEMDYLKDGIGLRAMAQRDPLVEYQREGYTMFQSMMGAIREESVGFLFNLEVEVQPGGVAARGLEAASAPQETLRFTAPSDDGGVEVRNQRGLLERAATAKAQLAAAQQATQFGGELPEIEQQPQAPRGPQRGGPQRPAPQRPGGQRGAFGQQQQSDGGQQNRQQRRAAERGQ
jgi:preprotein translocase subunit SecA